MHFQKTLSLIAGILSLVGFVPYIRAILKDRNIPSGTPGKNEPSKASWLIWTTLNTLTLVGMYAEKSANLQITGIALMSFVVLALSFKYGKRGWTSLDIFCICGAVLGLILWKVFDNPTLCIVISLIVILIGCVPAFTEAWFDPSKESGTAWTIFWVSSLLVTLSITKWTVATSAQPLVFLGNQTVMMYILYFRPRVK